jgi:hypothetical protein
MRHLIRLLAVAFFTILASACMSSREAVRSQPAGASDTAAASTSRWVVGKGGLRYRIIGSSASGSRCKLGTGSPGAQADIEDERAAAAGANPDEYAGVARGPVKTRIAAGPTLADVGSIADLYSTIPGELGKMPQSDRVGLEQQNVRIRAWLVAAKKETDNDFHLILGDDADSPTQFFNAEVTGLPIGGADRATLEATRSSFKNWFSASLPSTRYDTYDPPIPVEIEGSFFFDDEHAVKPQCGPVGTGRCLPCTAWEIHPVARITLEPEG